MCQHPLPAGTSKISEIFTLHCRALKVSARLSALDPGAFDYRKLTQLPAVTRL